VQQNVIITLISERYSSVLKYQLNGMLRAVAVVDDNNKYDESNKKNMKKPLSVFFTVYVIFDFLCIKNLQCSETFQTRK
jgi:hypothetical protein